MDRRDSCHDRNLSAVHLYALPAAMRDYLSSRDRCCDLHPQAAGWCGRPLNLAGRSKRLQSGEDVCGDGAKDAQAHALWSRRRAIHDTVESLGMKPLTHPLEHRPLLPPRYRVRQAELCKSTVPREISDVTQADSVTPQLTRQTVQRLNLVLSEPAVPLGPYGRLLGCEIEALDGSSALPAPICGRRRSVQRIAVHRRVTQPRARHGHACHSQIRHRPRLTRTSAPQAPRRSARAPRNRRRRGRRSACDGQARPVDG